MHDTQTFRWDDLALLLALRRRGTLAAAAADLGVDASTASRRLRAFEDALGAALFDRTPDGLFPTDLAERLLPHAEHAEEAALAVAAEAAGQDRAPEGRVRVACADAFAVYTLAPALPSFLESHPGLRVDLLVSTALVDLARREADVAVRFVRPTHGDLVARRIGGSGAYSGFVSADYARQHPDLRPENVDWIGWTPDKAHLPEALLYDRIVGREPRFRCDNLVVMMEAVRAGAGALLLPVAMKAYAPDLVEIPLPSEPFEVDAWVVTHRALKDVPRIRAVMDWLVERVTSMRPPEAPRPVDAAPLAALQRGRSPG